MSRQTPFSRHHRSIEADHDIRHANLATISAILSALALQGICSGYPLPDWLSGGFVSVNLLAQFSVFAGGVEYKWQGGQGTGVTSLSASSDAALIGGTANQAAGNAAGTYHMSCSNIEVPSGEMALFEVTAAVDFKVQGGTVSLDFEKDNFIMCPSVQIGLLTAPAIMVDGGPQGGARR